MQETPPPRRLECPDNWPGKGLDARGEVCLWRAPIMALSFICEATEKKKEVDVMDARGWEEFLAFPSSDMHQ